ncbi:MAG: helix-turn-helix domain-containing protein [Clostridia bacterium]|nr:helix-turn-helix domain-containing protein [Clostridia bacterium]
MLNSQNIDESSFYSSVKYTSTKDYRSDYSTVPRPCHNFVFMLEGEGSILTEDSSFQIKKGDILYIPQNSTYIANWSATPNCVFHSVHFKFSLSKDPFIGKKIPIQFLPCNQFEKLYESVQTIQQYQHSKTADAFLASSAFYYLCGVLLLNIKIKDIIMPESSITPAVIYLQHNYAKNCKIDYLASLCYLSQSRFFYLFKKQIGCSPITYKNKIAIQKAAQALLLYKDKSIETIAFEYGFESPIYFRRLFKRLTEKTPSQYRKENHLI